jgi:hypothetical protein
MRLKIKVEKVIERGIPSYKILEIEALKRSELPDDYLNGDPYCYLQENLVIGPARECLYMNGVYTLTDFNKKLSTLKECGERLGKINKNIKELRANWTGQETFII